MASGNLCLVAERLLGLLRSKDVIEIASDVGLRDKLLGFEQSISALAPLLLDAENKASDNKDIARWLLNLEMELFIVDNHLEWLVTEGLIKRRSSMSIGNNISKKARRFFSRPRPTASHFTWMLQRLIASLEGVLKPERNYDLKERTDKEIQFPNGLKESWDHDGDKMGIISFLLKGDVDEQQNVAPPVLPLLGTDQLETSRLARDVFNDEKVRKHFHKRIWIRLSGMSSSDFSTHILKEIVARLHPLTNYIEETDMDKLLKLLDSSLSRVRFLIVLDDVLIEKPECRLFLREFFSGIGVQGSKIIVTTCKKEVASITGTIQPYRLGCPSEDQLRSLFEKVAFGGKESENSHMIVIGKNIVKRCVGLPDLAITAIGSTLYFENSEAEWQSFYKNELSEIGKSNHKPFPFAYEYSKEIAEIMLLLKLCCDHLPSPLKHCFAYCCLFPKDHEIDVQMTIKLWMAQGFIFHQPEQSPEDVGYQYFLSLLRRSFFQEPTLDVRERVIKCKMHHLMHDLATLVAWGQCLLFSPDSFQFYRQYCSHVSFGNGLFSTEVATEFLEPNMRSLLLQSQLWVKYEARHGHHMFFDRIIDKYTFLRALDMRAFGIKTVPHSIGELKLLKYLDLSENEDIRELPNSITDLLNLQTLRLSSCFRLRQLPIDIRNLVNLRHLEIDGCYSLTSLPRGFGQLTNLRTLSQIVFSEDSSKHDVELNEVKGLSSLREAVQIKNLSHEKHVGTYLNAVPRGVRSLSLEWDSHASKTDCNQLTVDCNDLSPDLEELALNGFRAVTLFNPDFPLPSNLVKLSLKRCMSCRYLPSLDRLLHLKVLILDEMTQLEYILENDASSSTRFFPSLRELWLTELPKLQGWWQNRANALPSFPCLSKLVIEDCPMLASMPLFPFLEEGLVLDTTCWDPFKFTMNVKTAADEASSSTSLSFRPLSKLKNMCIVGIEELEDSNVAEIKWGTLESLRFLRLDCLAQLTTLPSGLQEMISLQELHIWRCGMEEINGIEALQFLEKLVIRLCPKLESLLEKIRSLEYLRTLEIEDCPTLLRRCEKKTGADWDKIAHIPEKRLAPISGR